MTVAAYAGRTCKMQSETVFSAIRSPKSSAFGIQRLSHQSFKSKKGDCILDFIQFARVLRALPRSRKAVGGKQKATSLEKKGKHTYIYEYNVYIFVNSYNIEVWLKCENGGGLVSLYLSPQESTQKYSQPILSEIHKFHRNISRQSSCRMYHTDQPT